MSLIFRKKKWSSTPSGSQVAQPPTENGDWFNQKPGDNYYGFENFGNTCYVNSVIQSLYFCKPFRELVESESGDKFSAPPQTTPTKSASPATKPATLAPAQRGLVGGHRRTDSMGPSAITLTVGKSGELKPSTIPTNVITVGPSPTGEPADAGFSQNLLSTLHDLFVTISSQKSPRGTIAPQAFVSQVKKDNGTFNNTLHHDAHEFLNFLLNKIGDIVEQGNRSLACEARTWVHGLFEGILTNETRCLTCESVTSREESFLDLSIDINSNSSVTSCLRQFSASEMLGQKNKFSCDTCCGLQEAEKRMKIRRLPNVLALNLKRFRYDEALTENVKLSYRVVFPQQLRVFATTDDAEDPDKLYELFSIVAHLGSGPTHGHYVSIVKSGDQWIVFDDNNVYRIEQHELQKYFGDDPARGSGYVLFYQSVDLDVSKYKAGCSRTDTEVTAASTKTTDTTTTSNSAGSNPPNDIFNEFSFEEDEPPPQPRVKPLHLDLGPTVSPLTPEQDLPTPIAPKRFFPARANSLPDPSKAQSIGTAPLIPNNIDFPSESVPASLGTSQVSFTSPTKDKESGWSVLGRRRVTSRIGRSLSMASSHNKDVPKTTSDTNGPATVPTISRDLSDTSSTSLLRTSPLFNGNQSRRTSVSTNVTDNGNAANGTTTPAPLEGETNTNNQNLRPCNKESEGFARGFFSRRISTRVQLANLDNAVSPLALSAWSKKDLDKKNQKAAKEEKKAKEKELKRLDKLEKEKAKKR